MGLDTVELLQFIEREFQITIPDDTAHTLATLGEIHAYVVQALQVKTGVAVDSANAWERLKQILVEHFAVRESELLPTTHVVHDLGLD